MADDVGDERLVHSAMVDRPTEPAEATGRARTGLPATLARRWPAALAVAVSIPGFTDPIGPDGIRTFAAAMLLLPLWYVVIEALGRRRATWPVLVAGIALFVLLELQDQVEPAVVLAGVALVAVLGGAIRGRLVRPSFLLQVAGLVAFGALSVAGLLVAPDLGRYLVAAAWFAHGLWDFAHLRADAGVARTGAEWCGVIDVLIAAQLVVVPLVLST